MTGALVRIDRHPIKSHGRETLAAIDVTAGATLPFDRHWAVLHEAARADGTAWAACNNFSRGAKAPALMAIDATLDEEDRRITLRHPKRPDLTIQPDAPEELPSFLDWVAPLMPANRAASQRIVSAGTRGMSDTDYPSISLLNLASVRALSQRLGQSLDPRRFRANLLIDNLAPWEEFDWVGRTVTIGGLAFRVEEPIERCLATAANPETGIRDADTLGALEQGWGHRNMGVYLTALEDGTLTTNSEVRPA